MPHAIPRRLYLCGGLQSSGSTLVSWCFLQHPRVDGVLDSRFDALPVIPQKIQTYAAWCKFTIACFRFLDVSQHFRDDGWEVRPLLVVRDPRAVFDSLIAKEYGRNGTTADDPPIRLRIRRFLRDFELFRQNQWPIMIFERLLAAPETELHYACEGLGLDFSRDMINWPKHADDIADCSHGNETFMSSRGPTLLDSIKQAKPVLTRLPKDDLDWLEEECAELNQYCGYPSHMETLAEPGRAIPTFQATRRYERYQRQTRLPRLIRSFFRT